MLRHVGILGGTFDPVHAGHLRVASQALVFAGLDGVLLAPSGTPPHRSVQTPGAQRLAMVQAACEGVPCVEPTDADLRNPGGYTVNLLKLLQRENPDTNFTFLLGADVLASLPHFYHARELFTLCDFVCYKRSGYDAEEAKRAAEHNGARVRLMPLAPVNVSSGMVRSLLAQMDDAPGLLPQNVAECIALRGFYREDYAALVRPMMDEKRFRHTLGVRDTAVHLARQYGASMQKAAVAGLLHDCAKCLPPDRMRALAVQSGFTADEDTMRSPALLHAPVGEYLARERFGVRDEQTLRAIRWHTTGTDEMDTLSLVLFVADAIEPAREEYPGLTQIRALARTSLMEAALCSMRATRAYIAKQGKPFSTDTDRAMAWLERAVNQ